MAREKIDITTGMFTNQRRIHKFFVYIQVHFCLIGVSTKNRETDTSNREKEEQFGCTRVATAQIDSECAVPCKLIEAYRTQLDTAARLGDLVAQD